MSLIFLPPNNYSSISLSAINDKKLIMRTILAYLIVSLCIHILFYLITIFHNQWQIGNIFKRILQRYFQRKETRMKTVNRSSLLTTDECYLPVVQVESCKITIPEKISSSSSSTVFPESETKFFRTIRSFGLFLCTILFLTNWFRLIIYVLPKFSPNPFQDSSSWCILQDISNLCIIQGFLVHVLTLFHFNLTISIRLFWHYCFLFSQSWQTITFRRLVSYLLGIFFFCCLITWPSTSNEWASIEFDGILNLCIVNYTFHFSYTFFVLSITCLLPFLVLIISHYEQMKSINHRWRKYFATFHIEQHRQNLHLIHQKSLFQYASSVVLIWSLINLLLLICIHIPMENGRMIKSTVYYMQMFAFIFDPILYIFIFRSLSIITLLRPRQ